MGRFNVDRSRAAIPVYYSGVSNLLGSDIGLLHVRNHCECCRARARSALVANIDAVSRIAKRYMFVAGLGRGESRELRAKRANRSRASTIR